MQWYFNFFVFLKNAENTEYIKQPLFFQIFYDLVRQINRKTPVPGKARKKSSCQLL